MSCADYEALLCDYVDGNLTEADRLLVERHLASCPTCAANARDAAAALAFLRRAPEPEPPVHLVNTILFNIPVPGLPPTAPCSPLVARLTARLRPFLQPRFAMGMAMTILSFSMLARFAGIGPRQIHPQELNPIRLWQALDDTAHRTWDRARKFYLSLRLVYEIQTQLREWYQQIPSQAGPPSPLPTQQEPNDRDLPPDPPPGRSAVSSPGSPKIGTGDTKP